MHTVKWGSGLAYKFGKTFYPENWEKCVIPEGGPKKAVFCTCSSVIAKLGDYIYAYFT